MPTASNSSSARARRCALSIPICCSSTSSIWKPTVKHGLRLAIGSWKIIAMSLPMIARRASGSRSRILRPSNSILSAVTFAVQGKSPITASIDTDLPEPDSPTIASTSPASTERLIPSTARNGPVRVANSTVRFFMSRRGIVVMFRLVISILNC